MATIMDEWKVMPRLAFLAMIVMAYRVADWYMYDLDIASRTVEASGFCSVVIVALTGSFAIWLGKEK